MIWRLLERITLGMVILAAPTLAWSQTAAQDQNSQAFAQQTEQSGITGSSSSTWNATPQELQMVELTPLPLMLPSAVENAQSANQSQSDYTQTRRMLWVIPNFAAVSADTKLPPLTARRKFALATEESVDYSSFTWTAILAGQAMATRSVPELGTGIKGYARYYWRIFADGVSNNFFTGALVPIITHEDPRYYTLGHRGFFRRAGYAISRAVVTRTDSGATTFNWSQVVGTALEAGLSNVYYPPQQSGLKQTARGWGEQMESQVINNIAVEFWPDIRHFILRHD